MKSISRILTDRNINPLHDGGPAIRIKSGSFMPLCIEHVGRGPNGLPAWSVCHYGEQNGDLMRDPEMCFEVTMDGRWLPYYFRNDYVGLEQNVFLPRENGQPLRWRPALAKELKAFARVWDRNIRQQGFVEAACEAAQLVTEGAL